MERNYYKFCRALFVGDLRVARCSLSLMSRQYLQAGLRITMLAENSMGYTCAYFVF